MPLRPVSELGLVDVTDLASREHYETATPRAQTRARRARTQSPRRDSGGDPRGERTVDQSERARGSTKGGGQTGRGRSKTIGGGTPKGSGRSQSGAPPTPQSSGTSPRRAARTPKRSGTPQTPAPSSDGAVKSANSRAPKNSVSSTTRRNSARTAGPRDPATPSDPRAASASAGKGATSRNGRSSGPSANRRGSRRSQGDGNGDSRKTQSASPAKTSQDKKQGSLVAKIGIPALTTAIGVAGGVLLSGKGLQRQHKILGTSLPTRVDIDLGKATARLGEASRKVGTLAGEIRTVREKTQQIAGAFSS